MNWTNCPYPTYTVVGFSTQTEKRRTSSQCQPNTPGMHGKRNCVSTRNSITCSYIRSYSKFAEAVDILLSSLQILPALMTYPLATAHCLVPTPVASWYFSIVLTSVYCLLTTISAVLGSFTLVLIHICLNLICLMLVTCMQAC